MVALTVSVKFCKFFHFVVWAHTQVNGLYVETTNKGQRKFPIYADDGIGTMLLTMFLDGA